MNVHSFSSRVLTALGLASLLVGPAALAKDKDAVGALGMDQTMTAGLYFGNGSRLNDKKAFVGGSQVVLHFEGGAYFLGTPLGNMGGIEGGVDMGYDGIPYRENDNILYGAGFLADMWVGFPITLLNLGNKNHDTLRVAFTPGIGMNAVTPYAYLRLRGAYRVTDSLDAELSWVWWPGGASSVWSPGSAQDGINAARIRGAVFLHSGRREVSEGWMLYAEYQRGQRENDNHSLKSDPTVFSGQNPYGKTERYDWEHMFHLGAGYVF
jgi:hypothetical protein